MIWKKVFVVSDCSTCQPMRIRDKSIVIIFSLEEIYHEYHDN